MNILDKDNLFITDKHVFFWKGKLSNFYKTKFTRLALGETHEFFCSEQHFMWYKAKFFKDEDTASKILSEKESPMKCKNLGREVKGYVDSEWEKVRYSVFLGANLSRFSQDKELKDFLLQDKFDNKTFVEANADDKIWAIGMSIYDPLIIDEKNWRGMNLLGKCITEVRNILKGQQK